MRLTLISDFACPWCFLGLHRLMAALAQRPRLVPDIRWLPYQLDPGLPADGIDRKSYLLRKFGDVVRGRAIHEAVSRTAAQDGLILALDRIQRMPSTVAAHGLMQALDGQPRLAFALGLGLFRAFLQEGRNIGDPAELAAIARTAGVGDEAIEQALTRRLHHATVLSLDAQLRAAGIHAIPSYVFNQTFMVSGAQEPRVLMPILDVIQAGQAVRAAAADDAGATLPFGLPQLAGDRPAP